MLLEGISVTGSLFEEAPLLHPKRHAAKKIMLIIERRFISAPSVF